MGNKIVFTNSLSSSLMQWLNSYSEEKKITKSAVIERALREYKEKMKKEEMEKSFQRASEDNEMLIMSEEGLEEYLDQLK